MPRYSRRDLDVRAQEYGFNRDMFEKVLRLRTILEFLNTQEYMREHLLLKGGTAINLTVFNLPRLSVDIDLDYIPNLTKEETVNERERLTEILKGYMSEQGYVLSDASRFRHSLDAFHYNYMNAAGNKDMIKIEINYSLRTHVLPSEDRVFVTDAFGEPIKVRTVAVMEIFAAKTNALISRAAARDLYDFCNLADMRLFSDEEDMFRKCIIFYATISAKEVNKDFDTSAIDSLTFSKIKSDLFPVLAVRDKFDLEGKKQQAKEYIASIMKPTEKEMDYMERFMAKEYKLTRERVKQLQDELEYLRTVREKEVADMIKEARSFGDLSENSEYDEAKNEQGRVYSRISELTDILSNYTIIENEATGQIGPGAKVLVRDVEFGDEETFEIVGSQEANPEKNRISDESPLGRALIGHKEGEKIVAKAPAGEIEYEILNVQW